MKRIVAVALSAVMLAACSPQAASSNDSILKEIGPVKAGDVVPELIGDLRTQVKIDPVPGVDLQALYTAMDKQMAPLLADLQARLARAPKPAGTVALTPAVNSSGAMLFALLADDMSGREYLEKTQYDKGEKFTGDGIVEDVKGVSEAYAENGQIVLHVDMNGEATKVAGQGADEKTVATVESLLIGEGVDANGSKTGQKTYVNLCPDATGLSHGKLSIQMSWAGSTTGASGKSQGQVKLAVTADLLGHVNDSADLKSYDLNNLTLQRSGSGTASSDAAGFYADGVSLTGVAPTSAEGTAWTSGGNAVEGPSARTAIHNMKRSQVEREIGLMVVFAKMHAEKLFRIAEKAWQDGYCLKLQATQGPDPKRLGPGQTTHFTIEVFHKPDNTKLDAPVIATGRNGKVDPAAKPVVPPARFSFTADGGQPKAYAAALKSTSRRGIAKLSLNFNPQGYNLKIVEQVSGGGPPPHTVTIMGTVLPDPTGTYLVGPGTAIDHVYANPELGCPGNWKDLGPRTFPLELKAVDKGDGNLEVIGTPTGTSVGVLGPAPITFGAFAVGDGGRVVASGTTTTTDDCTGADGPVTLTTVSKWTIEADPVVS